MWLIAESGSTSTDWLLMGENDEVIGEFYSPGINPTFLSEERIADIVQEALGGKLDLHRIQQVFFFGAGTASERLQEKARAGLKRVFLNAEIYADHDLTACAFACYEGEDCICCILGTGSNSVFFDGSSLREEVPSLAYILGDEASGVYFSKELIRAYFYKKLPIDLRQKFEEKYGAIDKDYLIERVYEQERPNAYLASFMPFIIENKKHPFIRSILKKGINEFLEYHVKCYPEHSHAKAHFVGSVASLLKGEILEVAADSGVEVGRFLQKPIDDLKSYIIKHRKRLLP